MERGLHGTSGRRHRRAKAATTATADLNGDDLPRVPRYTVRTVAERLGVPTATLRSWNLRYGVGPPGHSPGRHRLYSENDIAVLRQMHVMIGRGASARTAARAALETMRPARADVVSLMSAAFALDLEAATRFVEAHLIHYGVLETWERLVRPAYAQIEAQQLDGGCIDVEHMLSWTVARSLQRRPISSADAIADIFLACTETEAHTLPLEALRAALGERGRGVVMLGAAVPVGAVIDALDRTSRPATVVLWSQTKETADRKMVRAIVARGAAVVLGGPGWNGSAMPKRTVRVDSLQTAVKHLAGDG